jgi:excisionase family DNA binding protein
MRNVSAWLGVQIPLGPLFFRPDNFHARLSSLTYSHLGATATAVMPPFSLGGMMDTLSIKNDMVNLVGYCTAEEAAKKLGFHIVHVRKMIREGDLTGKKVGQMWFVQEESIAEYKEKTRGLDKFDPRRGNQ